MTGETYPATRTCGGWQGKLVRDRHGEPAAIVAMRVGPTWTDAVAIEGEHQTVAMRFHTRDGDGLVVPTALLDGSRVVWQRHGRAEHVLAELLELHEGQPR